MIIRGAWAQLGAIWSQRRLRAERDAEQIFEMSPALLAVAGVDGYLRRFNPAFEQFGYSREELLSRPWIEFAHPDDRARMEQAAEALARGEVVELENRVICRDGSLRWVQWSTRVVADEGLFFAAGRDVTEARRAAQEQAALRRVATLVARESAPDAVFAAVAREVGEVLDVDAIHLGRFDEDAVVSIGQWGAYAQVPIGARFTLEGDSVSSRVLGTGRPARMDGYAQAAGSIAATVRDLGIRNAIGVPIVADGRTWGVMIATTGASEPFPIETEARLQHFTELVATAISNAEARAEVARLAAEQSALRRVATLVAEGSSPGAVFDAVTMEVKELLDAEAVVLARYDGDDLVVLATHASSMRLEVGERVPIESANLSARVRRTARPARQDDPPRPDTAIGGLLARAGVRTRVVAPVVVDGQTWGVLAATWREDAPPPEDTEQRMARFAALLDTAIANADSREQLTASRARVLAAGDEARRRLARDLHDGAQQRLVHTVMTLKLTQRALRQNPGEVEELVAEALGSAERANAELRELAHGILPSVLTQGGLRAGVRAFASRLDLPVDVQISVGPLPREVEASAYFIVAEALTNVIKHAGATHAKVIAKVDPHGLCIQVRDDGVGGADPQGSGLVGVADRVDALGGELTIDSGRQRGTVVAIRLPLAS